MDGKMGMKMTQLEEHNYLYSTKKVQQQLEMSDCENVKFSAESFEDQLRSPNIEHIHTYVIARLLTKFRLFEQFVISKAFMFPGIHEIAYLNSLEIMKLYKNVLVGKNDQLKSEAILGVKHQINRTRKIIFGHPLVNDAQLMRDVLSVD
uniref:Uncharacterized protein n=1 Tax=Globodera rostochiensis TaxID=31243 RepID=A0A914I3U1_GLORO